MPVIELVSLFILGGLAWLWFDSLKARDAGIAAARQACAADDLQLLDDTVSIAGLKPARNDDGQLVLRRVYEFEYSDTGDNRRRGSVTLLGDELVMLYVGPRPVRAPEAPPTQLN